MFVLHHPFTTMDPTSPTDCHTLTFYFSYPCTEIHQSLSLLVGYHKALPMLHKFSSFPNDPQDSQTKGNNKKQIGRNPWKPKSIQHHNKVARPYTGHKKNQKSSRSKSQNYKSTRIATSTMTQSPWFPRKYQLEPSSIFHNTSFHVILASYCHKHIIVSA